MRAATSVLVIVLASLGSARAAEELSAEVLLAPHEATDAHRPAAAFGNDVFLVVWEAGRSEQADVVGMRLDRSGRALDAKPFVISGARDVQDRPHVAFGGGSFLVVWQDLRNEKDYDVRAARVTPEGKVLDTESLLVAGGAQNQCEPAVCFDGKAFQVVWRHFHGEGYHIHGGRVAPDGRLLEPEGVFVAQTPKDLLRRSSLDLGKPALVADGNGAILAGATSYMYLKVWRMQDGKTVGPVVIVPWGCTYGGANDPAFASDGKNFLATMTSFLSAGGRSSGDWESGMLFLKGDADLVAKEDRFQKKYTVGPKCLSTTPVVRERRHVRHPSPAWDGKTFVVAWDISMGNGQVAMYDAVFLRRVSAAGEPLGQDLPVAGEPESPAYRPAAASDGAGATLIAYERHPKTGDVPIKIGLRMLSAK